MHPFPFSPDGIDIHRIQYLSIIGSVAVLAFIFELTRKKKIGVQYAILWFFLGAAFLGLSIWRHGLDVISRAVGVVYPPAALFLLLILGAFAILVQFSVVISRLSAQSRKLAQELGVLKSEIERLTSEKTGLKTTSPEREKNRV
jgi:hypothetical protein